MLMWYQGGAIMLFPTWINLSTTDMDKDKICASYMGYYLNRLLSMFKYEGLPDSIPQKWLETYLLVNGNCAIVKHQGELYAVHGNLSDYCDGYYIPTKYIVANPWLKLDKTFTRDEDCIVIFNDSLNVGVMPLLKRYCYLMTENLISMKVETINSRMSAVISTPDDKTKASAELYIKRIEEGKLSVLAENRLLDGVKVQPVRAGSASNITNLIEMQQYLKASLYNELGLNANYNMKREAINSNESQLNDDMLTPLIDDMLRERQEAIEKVNAMFGTSITVEFNSAWEDNEDEHEAAIEELEAEVDQVEAEADKAEAEAEVTEVQAEAIEEAPAEENTEADPEETADEPEEETPEEDKEGDKDE